MKRKCYALHKSFCTSRIIINACHAPFGEFERDTGAGLHDEWGFIDTQNTGTENNRKTQTKK